MADSDLSEALPNLVAQNKALVEENEKLWLAMDAATEAIDGRDVTIAIKNEVIDRIRAIINRQPINMGLSPEEAFERISEIARVIIND